MKNFFIPLILTVLVSVATFFSATIILGSTNDGEEISQNETENDDVDETDVDETDVDETDVDETDVDETDVDETDVDETDVDETDVDETDVDETDVDETDVDKTPEVVKKPNKPKPIKSSGVVNDDFLSLLKDVKKWVAYNTKNIEFSYDFTPLDISGAKITKKDFLEKQITGEYIASKKSNLIYQLNKVPADTDPKIVKKAKGYAKTALYFLIQEGRLFPEFSTKDIKGNIHSNNSSKGKLLVVKCWFVQCLPCVKEFPELNHIFDKYESSDKIEFLSFAFDKEEKIKKFLSKKEFRYPVLPEQQKFITKEIKARKYPSHVLIGKDGKILKMFNNVNILEHFIEKYK